MDDNENEATDFDFHKEIEEFQNGHFIKDVLIENEKPGQSAQVTITTLENIIFKLNWTLLKGIEIVEAK